MIDMPHGSRIRRLALVICAVALAACSSLRTDFVKHPSSAMAPDFDTPTGRYVRAQLAQHSKQSGFRLLDRNTEALMTRISLADHAHSSIDVQYYIFDNDDTGRLVAQRLLAAADRGVRVRILLDDISLSHEDNLLGSLDAHPNMQVRLFNPFRTRSPSIVSKVAQLLLEARRLNRRMHNKSFIVDGIAAVVGGRNIGDAYFDAGEQTHFSDLDVLAIGPVADDASRIFDAYWNSDAAYPVKAYSDNQASATDLARTREQLKEHVREFAQTDYAQAALEDLPEAAVDARRRWCWGAAVLVADDPQKVEARGDEPALRIGPQVKTILDTAQKSVLLLSPYFIPGRSGTTYFAALVRRGVTMRALTNSLAATDEPEAHAAYANHRRDLLEAGVDLYELKPAAGKPQRGSAGGSSSGLSLHAKAVVVDDRYVFVGSMNMDPRSKLLNTEMGVIVDCPELAADVTRFFEAATQPENAFHVQFEAGDRGRPRLQWSARTDGAEQLYYNEPEVPAARRLGVDFMRLLPIEGWL